MSLEKHIKFKKEGSPDVDAAVTVTGTLTCWAEQKIDSLLIHEPKAQQYAKEKIVRAIYHLVYEDLEKPVDLIIELMHQLHWQRFDENQYFKTKDAIFHQLKIIKDEIAP